MTRHVPAIMLAVALCTHGGCVQTPKQTGVRVGDETLRQFEVGVTTEAWLLAILGPPTGESPVEGVPNTKVLRYALVETTGGLDAVFSGGGGKNTAVVYFIITEGTMTRFWADRATERTMLGQPVEASSGEKQAP